MMTLVALLAVTMQAWADETPLVTITFDSNGPVYSVEGLVTLTGTNYTLSSSNSVYYWNPSGSKTTVSATVTAAADNVSISKVVFWSYDGGFENPLEDTAAPYVCYARVSKGRSLSDDFATKVEGIRIAKVEVYGPAASSASAVEVAWDAATKTATLTNKMPAGNVAVTAEYFPQATVSEGALTAATGVAATTSAPLVTLDASTLTGATKLMYLASTDATKPAYDAQGWSDKVPTADSFTEAGNVNVWYYPVGTDDEDPAKTFSDGDICANALTVTLAAAPTYGVTFADGIEESDKWTVSPKTDVKKGTEVTVTYTGTRKVLGVKAEKKIVYTTAANATVSDIGKVVCAAGHLHDAKALVPDGCTAVGILGHVTGDGHGYILALMNAAGQSWETINGWNSYADTELKQLPEEALGSLTSYSTLGETSVSNWCVAPQSLYINIFSNLGSKLGSNDQYAYDSNVNAYITGAGGTAMSGTYMSSMADSSYARAFNNTYGWNPNSKTSVFNVRPIIAF